MNAFKKVIEIDDKYAYAYYALGLADEKVSKWENAIENYEKFNSLIDDKSIQNSINSKINLIKKKHLNKE